MSHKKFGPDQFSRFDVYWIQTDRQTDKQTNRQAKFIDARKNTMNSAIFFILYKDKMLKDKTTIKS